MRVLFIAPRLPHALALSGNQIVYQRMKRLMEQGFEVGLACYLSERDRPDTDKVCPGLVDAEFVQQPFLNRIAPERLKYGHLNAASSFLRYWSPHMNQRIAEMVDRSRYDVVVCEYSAMAQFVYRNPFLPAVRVVVSCHESPTLNARKLMEMHGRSPQGMKKWLEFRHMRHLEFSYYRQADHILTLSPEEKGALLDECPDLRVTAVPAGVDVAHFTPMPEVEQEHAIVFTGRFSSEQNRSGVQWFIDRVWPKLRVRHPTLTCYLVGRDPTPQMRTWAARDKRILVTGKVDDIRPYLARAKVYVAPLRSGSGLRPKLLEAMAMGLPVVSTSVGAEGIPLHTGRSGFLADTSEIFDHSISMLLEDDALRREVGVTARRLTAQRFSWEHSTEVVAGILREITAKRSYHFAA